MPIYQQEGATLRLVPQLEFKLERELQTLIESNLDEVFGCRLVATEFSTGTVHGGRIDSLAISEDNNPVIIEYKKVESADLINQSLFYLDWIKDHRGDYEVAVRRALGDVQIDWAHIRVICIAPSYSKYALHAVKQMGTGVELWEYHRYANGSLELEEVYRATESRATRSAQPGTPVVAAGPTLQRIKGEYTYEMHASKLNPDLTHLATETREFVLGLNPSIAEVPQKTYVAYKLAKNIVCLEVQKRRLAIFVKLDLSITVLPPIARDVTNLGHYGTGNVEISVANTDELAVALELIRAAYLQAGGD